MPFALSLSEPLPSEIRRVARERLRDAHRRLEKKTDDPFDVRVHEARKRTKEVRALLRLTRDEIGRDAYKRENARLRDAARLLAPVRDAQVLARMIEDAHAHHSTPRRDSGSARPSTSSCARSGRGPRAPARLAG